jgi:hypothetical protein
MKNILPFLCNFFLVILIAGGCSQKYVFSEKQTYQVSEEQLKSLAGTNVGIEALRNLQLKTNKNDINISYGNVEYVLRRTPPPPPPCQCKPQRLTLAVDPATNQFIVRSREDNLLVSYGTDQVNRSLSETISALPNKELILETR